MGAEEDIYIGMRIKEYEIREKIGKGRMGTVYKAVRENPHFEVACKIIPEAKLKRGWDVELQKVTKLNNIGSIVNYRDHDSKLDKNQNLIVWVLMDYIDGQNLNQYLELNDPPVNMAFIELVLLKVLEVLHACYIVDIKHGDLHPGNILISKPDPRIPGSPRRVFVSDFGYGGSHNEVQPKNDFTQLFSIIMTLLRKLDPAELTSRDRIMREKLVGFLQKGLLETDKLQGSFVRVPALLIDEVNRLMKEAVAEASFAGLTGGYKGLGDFLATEMLGNRVEEWKNLFVSDFLAAKELLSQNNTVLTGARGCGKTMAFRRLTLFMDELLGEPSGVVGAEHFLGFYLNCRDLVELFPYIPKNLTVAMQEQLIHGFHLGWLSEIFSALTLCSQLSNENLDWLDPFMSDITQGRHKPIPHGGDVLSNVKAYVDNEKERCRITSLGKLGGIENWPFARMDLLEKLQAKLEKHLSTFQNRPLYFFLDDFTSPMIANQLQRVLNTIIFKRRSRVFFKVSTEASNSFERQDIRGKRLEYIDDFVLIDLATESLYADHKERIELLEKIFKPRIERDAALRGKDLTLSKILGTMGMSNNKLAAQMRDKTTKRKILYHGIEAFEGMWTSDVRIMIRTMMSMLRHSVEHLSTKEPTIPASVQNDVYRSVGGEFLLQAKTVEDPSSPDSRPKAPREYGTHLHDIVQAFVNTSRYELTEGKIVKNVNQRNPRQAFRLEIVDDLDLSKEHLRYYDGLVRWHIFMEDWRGKSIRGGLTQRLFLNRALIPYAQLTFSRKDSIQLTNEQFVRLLERPKEFMQYWKKRRRNHEGPTLGKWSK